MELNNLISSSKIHPQYKKILCKPFMETGYCKFGKNCHFAHGHKDLLPKKNRKLYKTRLCGQFINTGYCDFNHLCFYAHGKKELRFIIYNLKYKTKKCKEYYESWNCPFENNCNYIHDDDVDLYKTNININDKVNPWDGSLNLGLIKF
jgi:hypothetical protein